MKSQVFEYIGHLTDGITQDISNHDISSLVTAVEGILLVWFTLYIMARGYMILSGKSDEPVKDLLYKLGVFAVIMTFATNGSGWLNMVNDAINGINEWAQGGTSIYTQLDNAFNDVVELGNLLQEEEDDGGPLSINLAGIMADLIALLAFGLFAIPAVGIIIVASFVLKILILIAPLMILSLLFPWIKDIFSKWIGLIISNTFTVLLVGIAVNILTNKYEEHIKVAKIQAGSIGENGLSLAVELLFVSIVLTLLVLMARGIAQQLSYVSIESLPGSVGASAVSSAGRSAKGAVGAAGATGRGAVTTGKAVGKGSRYAIDKIKNQGKS